MPVRSSVLFDNSLGTNIVKTLWTVPAERTAIIKDLSIGAGGSVASTVQLFIQGETGADRLVWRAVLQPSTCVDLHGLFWVIDSGRSIKSVSTGGGSIIGFGALLDGAAE